MESITSHIKKSSASVHAPTWLKSRVMTAVTQPDSGRSTDDGSTIVRPSPYFTFAHTKSIALVGTLCMIVVIGISSFQTQTTPSPTISIADTIINDIATETTYDESWYESVRVIDDLSTYSQLIYSGEGAVSSSISNVLL